MLRNTRYEFVASALRHNIKIIQQIAPQRKLVAMVKANAYGCGVNLVVPELESIVDYYGVIGIQEAYAIAKLGAITPVVILQAGFTAEEWRETQHRPWIFVVHQHAQLNCLINTPLLKPIQVWVKINTGMNRLGFKPDEITQVAQALNACPWVKKEIVLMSHFANADQPENATNNQQINTFHQSSKCFEPNFLIRKSLANSAGILAIPSSHLDIIRPGISLYGVSPFEDISAKSLGLRPVIRFRSNIMDQFTIQPGECVGYGSSWQAQIPTKVGVIPVGYGDGYPRVVAPNTHVYINNKFAPIIGRISMDSMTVNLSAIPDTKIGDLVELWGDELPVESVATAANTIAYELLCKSLKR